MSSRLTEVIHDYRDKDHIRGDRDCNLMFLKVHEPQLHTKLHQKYTTIVGGVRAALRLLGVRSVHHFLVKNNYTPVQPSYQLRGDIIVFENSHNVYISLGSTWFGVNDDDSFGIINRYEYCESTYNVFRKE